MAHVLSEWPEGPKKCKKVRHYQWDLWLDGQVWELERAEWGGDPASFRNAAWRYTHNCGGRVRIKSIGQGKMVIQYLEGSADAE